MPLAEITLVEGRAPELIRDLVHAVHAAIRDSLGVPEQNIRVVVREVPPTHWAAGDVTIAERRASEAGRDDTRRGRTQAPGDGAPVGGPPGVSSGRPGTAGGGTGAAKRSATDTRR